MAAVVRAATATAAVEATAVMVTAVAEALQELVGVVKARVVRVVQMEALRCLTPERST